MFSGSTIHDPNDPVFDVWRHTTPDRREHVANAAYEYFPSNATFYAPVLSPNPQSSEETEVDFVLACPWGVEMLTHPDEEWEPSPGKRQIANYLNYLYIDGPDYYTLLYATEDFTNAWDAGAIPPIVLRYALKEMNRQEAAR